MEAESTVIWLLFKIYYLILITFKMTFKMNKQTYPVMPDKLQAILQQSEIVA